MSDEHVPLAAVLALVRRRRRLVGAAAVVGAMVGGLSAIASSPEYASRSQVLVEDRPDKARLDSEVRIASSQVVLDRVAAALGNPGGGAGLVGSVSADVARGNVLRITARADAPARARAVAEAATREYIAYSSELLARAALASVSVLVPQRDALRRQVEEIDRRLAGVGATTDTGAAREQQDLASARFRAVQEIADIEGRIAAGEAAADNTAQHFVVIDPAVEPRGGSWTAVPLRAGEVAVLCILLTTVGLVTVQRRDTRLGAVADIARAAGVPVLGVVPPPSAGWPDGVDHDADYVSLRYRRVLGRIGEQLQMAPGGTGAAVTLAPVAGDGLAELVAEHVAGPEPRWEELRIIALSPARPALPDVAAGSWVIPVLTVGTLTQDQIMALSAACHDAGAAPLGLLLVVDSIDHPAARMPLTGPVHRVGGGGAA